MGRYQRGPPEANLRFGQSERGALSGASRMTRRSRTTESQAVLLKQAESPPVADQHLGEPAEADDRAVLGAAELDNQFCPNVIIYITKVQGRPSRKVQGDQYREGETLRRVLRVKTSRRACVVHTRLPIVAAC